MECANKEFSRAEMMQRFQGVQSMNAEMPLWIRVVLILAFFGPFFLSLSDMKTIRKSMRLHKKDSQQIKELQKVLKGVASFAIIHAFLGVVILLMFIKLLKISK